MNIINIEVSGKYWKGIAFNFPKLTVKIYYSLGNIGIDYITLKSDYYLRIIGLPKLQKRAKSLDGFACLSKKEAGK